MSEVGLVRVVVDVLVLGLAHERADEEAGRVERGQEGRERRGGSRAQAPHVLMERRAQDLVLAPEAREAVAGRQGRTTR